MRPLHAIADTVSAAISRPLVPTSDATTTVVLLGMGVLAGVAVGYAIGRRGREGRDRIAGDRSDELFGLADTPHLGFARFDAALVATAWNHGMERLLAGIAASDGSVDEAAARGTEERPDWWKAIHPEDRPRLRATLRGLEHEQSASCDFRVRRDRGRWWSMRGTIHRNVDGTSALLFHDDSQGDQARRSLESAARLRKTIEIAVESIHATEDLDQTMCELLALIGEELGLKRIGWLEVDANHRCREIATWSPAWSRNTAGILPATITAEHLTRLRSGQAMHDCTGETDRFASPIRINGHLDSVLVAEFESDADRRDEVALVFGRFCESVGRHFERLEAERERESFAAIRGSFERSEMLLQLAGGLRHDFNNVAFAIGGRILLLLQRTDDPAIIQGLEEIRDAVDAANHLIERVAPSAGDDRRPVEISVRAELEEIANTARRLLPRRLEIDLECDDETIDDDVVTHADLETLQRLVLNLVVNSRDAITGRGRIRISARRPESGWVEIRIDDDGPGIPPQDRERYLQPFESGPSSTGAGLGLSLCHRLAAGMGGRFSLDESPLGGLGVHLALPVSNRGPRHSSESTAAADDPPRMPRAALLIEDNTVVREVITAHLDQAGTSVTTACDALDAEDRLEADPRIEMLVMDVDLPGRSGIDAITALRAKGDRTPCVLITGGTLDPPPVDRMQVLRKPFGMEPLIATMRSLLATCESGADTEHRVS